LRIPWARVIIQEALAQFPPIAGMAFLCPGDRAIMHQAQARLLPTPAASMGPRTLHGGVAGSLPSTRSGA